MWWGVFLQGTAMRRNDKEIRERAEMEAIIGAAQVCRLAMVDDGRPYLVPLNFGFAGNTLYFHGAGVGKKLDVLRRNDQVCFLFDIDHELVRGEQACNWGMRYRSVIGYGSAAVVDDPAEKEQALTAIMRQYSAGEFSFPPRALHDIAVFKVTITSMTGKKSGY